MSHDGDLVTHTTHGTMQYNAFFCQDQQSFTCCDSYYFLELLSITIIAHESFLEVFRQKNVPAGFSMKSSYILFTDSKTVLG